MWLFFSDIESSLGICNLGPFRINSVNFYLRIVNTNFIITLSVTIETISYALKKKCNRKFANFPGLCAFKGKLGKFYKWNATLSIWATLKYTCPKITPFKTV